MGVGKRYRAKHIIQGLANYPEGNGILYVSQDAIDRMRNSFIGKPVVNWDHTDLAPEELLNFSPAELEEKRIADGVIAGVGKDEDGWDYVDAIIWNEETQKNIEKNGYSVSNAYMPTKMGPGGKLNNVDYDEELLDGEYLHLAIVPNPRYEKARIFANSKKTQEDTMGFKLFRNNQEPEKKPEPTADVEMETKDAYVVNEAGEKIPVEELINAYKQACKNEAEKDDEMLNMDDLVEVDGEKIAVKDLMDAYAKTLETENAEPIQEPGVAEEVVEKQNAAPKQVNAALKNAATASTGVIQSNYKAKSDRLSSGKTRYGSKVKQEV